MSKISLEVVKDTFNKLQEGKRLDSNDIKKLIFDDNFKLPDGFLTSEDFDNLVYAFNFNGDDKVDINDFEYLIDHISDLDVIIKLTQVVSLSATKFCKLKNVKLSAQDTIDTIVRILIYCVLFICVTNSDEFAAWCQKKTPSGTSNGELLFMLISQMVDYIKVADEVKKIVERALTYFKTKCGFCTCISDSSTVDETDPEVIKANVEIRSLNTQLSKKGKKNIVLKKNNKL